VKPSPLGILYRRELRSALRDRAIVVNSILIPLLVYPLVIWIAFTVISLIEARSSGLFPRTGLAAGFADEQALAAELRLQGLDPVPVEPGAGTALIEDGSIDALLEPEAGPPGLQRVSLSFDGSIETGRTAASRASDAVTALRDRTVLRMLPGLGVSPRDWSAFRISMRNQASAGQMGAFILSLMIPITFAVMVSVGCFYPAIDSVSGERERSTWETLLSSSASRRAILASKYLYVATFGMASGLLNLTAISLTMPAVLAPMLRQSGEYITFDLGLPAIAVSAVAAVLLAAFQASGMMIFASLARNSKEGQAMLTPFYMLTVLPVAFLQRPDLVLTPSTAAIPVVNVVLLMKSAFLGRFDLLASIITAASMAAVTLLCLAAAGWLLGHESVMTGSYQGSPVAFVKGLLRRSRLRGRSAAAHDT
jgi:sodium transport system permease protein